MQDTRELFCLTHMAMWTKLRPGLRPFLARMRTLYEMAIYTHGDRPYAAEMAWLIDPTGSLFGGRIISQVCDGAPRLSGRNNERWCD